MKFNFLIFLLTIFVAFEIASANKKTTSLLNPSCMYYRNEHHSFVERVC